MKNTMLWYSGNMTQVWVYSLASVGLISLISLIGVFALGINEARLKGILSYLISFSAGALLGDAFLHIIPEATEQGGIFNTSSYLLVGIIIFFLLERFFRWHHSHTSHEESIHTEVYLTIFGDVLHNFIDGVAIAASFLVSFELGLATTLAVILHEIPQEVGQFGILVHGGWSPRKALLYNFLSALRAVAGALAVLLFANNFDGFNNVLLVFGAAGFF